MKRQIIYKKFDSTRKFGVEIEVDNAVPKSKIKKQIQKISTFPVQLTDYVPSVDNNCWHIKNDASCGPEGWEGPCGYEVVTPVMSGWADVVHVGEVTDRLREAGLRINRHCGVHVHVDASDLTPGQVGKIVGYWYKIQPKFTHLMPPGRLGNRYCRLVSPNWLLDWKSEDCKGIWDCFKPNDLTDGSIDRHFNLNLVNYARSVWNPWNQRRTLELRWPEGTLSGRDVKNWIRLFVNFVDTAAAAPAPKNLHSYNTMENFLTALGLHHDEKFYILSEGLLDTKSWLLERFLQFSRTPKSSKLRTKAKTLLATIRPPTTI